MSKKLAGTLFVYRGNKFDYCYIQSIECLLQFCDKVFVAAGGDDITHYDIDMKFGDRIWLYKISDGEWHSQKGKEKLNYFTNICISQAEKEGYEYQFNLQADECITERSYKHIKEAIETGAEAFMCTRINLWKDNYHYLDVPQDRKPCSTEIIRLSKTNYRSVDDAENIGAYPVDFSFLNNIRIFHYGFTRRKDVMKDKIIHIQEKIFGFKKADDKLDNMEVFDWSAWFKEEDLKIINEPHPEIMKYWISARP